MKNYYVYVFLDTTKPGEYKYGKFKFDFEPYYVGKGSGDRDSTFNRGKGINYRTNKINEAGCKPIAMRLYDNLEELDAIKKETTLIKKIGVMKNGTGPLLNQNIDTITHFNKVRKSRNKKKIINTELRNKAQDSMMDFINTLGALK